MPEIVGLELLDTLLVLTVNVALVLPAATVTLAGTVATDVFGLVSDTTAPPDGALALSATVPVELFPPLTLVGFRFNEEMVRPEEPPGVRVKVADLVAPPDCPKT